MRMLVTGGAGFIGQHLVRSLLTGGHSVRVLDNLHRGSFEGDRLAGAELILGDVRDARTCSQAASGCESVVHLAAQSNVMGSEGDPDYAFTTNVVGTWNVARAAAESGARTLIFASSREVYGDCERLPVSEDAPLQPKNTYGATKAAAETLLLGGGCAGATSVRVLRLANVVGPGDCGRVVPTWLAAARAGVPLDIYGGSQVLDFVPVGTVVQAITAALEIQTWDGPVNVGTGIGTSLLTLAELILAKHLCTNRGLRMLPARSAEVVRFVPDVTRLRTTLGVEPPSDPLRDLPSGGDARW